LKSPANSVRFLSSENHSEVREALSDWIALRLRMNLEIPEIGHLNLNCFGTPASA